MLGSLGNPHEAIEVHPLPYSVHPYCLSNFGGSHALCLPPRLPSPSLFTERSTDADDADCQGCAPGPDIRVGIDKSPSGGLLFF